ncbi:restriction endonuclease [Mesorhizobium sp. M0633]|uniref:restriction endonuclease n=1 Tax=Mesorhizobium sp. M0633 TaxID=2956977 RepID=UPI00333797E6
MAGDWKEYQEETAEFFRSLGLAASTDVTMKGVRTEHDVDVLVEIDMAGFTVRWIVECKHWKHPVNKLHVLALREIVSDLGADRGIILCEVGFQSGAVEAASLTNVQVSSLCELSTSSRDAIASFQLRELFDRAGVCRERYWQIPKARRIEKGLRPDLGDAHLYSGIFVVEVVERYLSLAFRGAFPIALDLFDIMKLDRKAPKTLSNPSEVLSAFEPLIAELEGMLDAAEG